MVSMRAHAHYVSHFVLKQQVLVQVSRAAGIVGNRLRLPDSLQRIT